MDLTRLEVWWMDPFPPIHDELHPELGMLRAVDPKHSNQDFSITHPGGCVWELMRRPHAWQLPESRSRLWRGFREMAHGVAAPVAHLKELLQEANAASKPITLKQNSKCFRDMFTIIVLCPEMG